MGPVLIFDKSLLESLNSDEAMWLDTFFIANITPLFFVETLADLEKQVRKGRTPEEVVGSLAYRTPDMGSSVNAHHAALLEAELFGGWQVEMSDGRPVLPGGRRLELEGKKGVIFQPSPEQEAFARWQRREFLDLERANARAWRRGLSRLSFSEMYELFRPFFPLGKPRTLLDVKRFVDFYLDGPDRERVLIFGLALVGVAEDGFEPIVKRWKLAGKPPIRDFAPYFAHVLSVDMFFYLALASDVIGRGRPSHKIDLAYLYYLPFCMAFTSNDKLHADLVPIFLRENQSFVPGKELKADLARLDKHFDSLPDEVKNRGVMSFAHSPPRDDSFLVARLWDKHMSPRWREQQPIVPPPENELGKTLMDTIRRFEKEGTPLPQDAPLDSADLDHLVIQRKVYARKGKWLRLPPEVLNASREDEED